MSPPVLNSMRALPWGVSGTQSVRAAWTRRLDRLYLCSVRVRRISPKQVGTSGSQMIRLFPFPHKWVAPLEIGRNFLWCDDDSGNRLMCMDGFWGKGKLT